jgi:hypothetical protein
VADGWFTGPDGVGAPYAGSGCVDPSRGYFPRAVFFFGFGLLVLPVLPGAASFLGRFGDTGSLPSSFAGGIWLPARSYSVGAPLWPCAAIWPQIQIGEPGLPEHRAVACKAGDGDRERLLQRGKTGEGGAPVRSAEVEPGDGGVAAVPADDPPGEGVGLGRPGDSQLITGRPNYAEGISTRACGTASAGVGSAWVPVMAGCWLSAQAEASDASDDPSPAAACRPSCCRLDQRL